MNLAAQPTDFRKLLSFFAQQAMIWLPFVLGLGWLVIRPLGLHFSVMLGNYGDTRLINYILEHFYLWASGLEPSYWSARIFYPFPLTIAFSDNLLGTAPFYTAFRALGLDREISLQVWFVLGFTFNFIAAVYVLRRLGFHPLSVGLGAFFFTFGLPMLAQFAHLQLLYRFCVPLAVYLLWQFAHQPRWWRLAAILLLTGWQLWISVYTGVFLILMLIVMGISLPFFIPDQRGWRRELAYWPAQMAAVWRRSTTYGRLGLLASAALFVVGSIILFQPYMQVTHLYSFTRSWPEVMTMLPRPQSYLIADHATYWMPVSRLLGGVIMRHEHQLFPGLTVIAVLVIGLVWRFSSRQRNIALNSLTVAAVLAMLTLAIGGFSLYRVIWMLPGMDSIRSVTRIELLMMWPLAVFLAYALDGLLFQAQKRPALFALVGILAAGLLFEPATFTNRQRYSTRHARQRLVDIRAQLPDELPEDPILFLAVKPDESEVVSEVDAMLLAQELGWPTLNGYSGNNPPGYSPAISCIELPRRVLNYMKFADNPDQGFYRTLMRRVVPIGFKDCEPIWWQSMPPDSILD